LAIFLIIGGSGFIGENLYKNFSKLNKPIYATYTSNFEKFETNKHYFKFNIFDQDFNFFNKFKNLKYVFLCYGVSKVSVCEENKEFTEKINVFLTIKLLKKIKELNLIPIYFSTSLVYDGKKKFYTEVCIPNPILEYGKQKLEIERYIETNFDKYFIFRLTKIYGVTYNDNTLFTNWHNKLINNKEIFIPDDLLISPLLIDDLIKIIQFLIKFNYYGLYNVSGQTSLEMFDFALLFSKYFNFDSTKIKKCLNVIPYPKYNALDCSKIKKIMPITYTSYEKSFEMFKNKCHF
jgi:dTDP-4-dehydrorhamnose reductase